MILNKKTPEDTVNQRLRKFIRSLEMQGIIKNDTGFAESVGFKKQTVSLYLGETKLSSDFLIAVSKRYPNLSLYWLLLGEGPMLREGEAANETVNNSLHKEGAKIINPDEFDRLIRFYNFGMEEITRLCEENKRLYELLRERESQIYKQSLG